MRGFSLVVCAAAASLLAITTTAPSQAGHCHHACKKCVICCCQNGPPSYDREAEPEPRKATRTARSVAPAPIVQSMPMYAMPAMFATMPVVPAMATRSAEPRGASDCCDRVDKLEIEMKNLAKAVSDLQDIVEGQTRVLEVLAKRTAPPTAAPAVVVP
jgi:hypothetical protein